VPGGNAVLEHLEGWLSVAVDHDGLAVENDRSRFDFGNGGGDSGKFPGKVVTAAREQAHFFGVFNGLEAVAVEFEQPEPKRFCRAVVS